MKDPTPPTNVQILQIRDNISRILELPRSGVGCIILVPYAIDGGNDSGLRMLTMGLSAELATQILLKAADTSAHGRPIRSGTYEPPAD